MPFQGINITNTDYIPQYVGMPLEAMERVGDELQTRHYENIAKARQLELFGMQQMAETPSDADKRYIQGQLQGIRSSLEEMARSGAENATGKVGALATAFLGNEGLNRMKRNAAQYRTQQEMMAKLGESGVFNKAATDRYLQQGTIGEDGKFYDFMSSAQERLNYDKKADEIFDPLQADTYQTDLVADLKTSLGAWGIDKVVPGVSGDISKLPAKFKTTIIERLGREKIEDFAFNKGGWESYKNSSEYAQQKNILGKSEEEIKETFLSRGLAKIKEKILKDWETNPLLSMLKGKGEEVEGLGAGQGEQLPGQQIEFESGLGDVEDFLDMKRSENQTPVSTAQGATDAPGAKTTVGKVTEYTGAVRNIPAKRWEKLNEYAKLGQEIFGQDPNFKQVGPESSPQERQAAAAYAKQYNDLVAARVQYRINDTSWTTRSGEVGRDNAEDLTTDMLRNLKSRVIYDEATGKKIPVTNEDGTEYHDKLIDAVGNVKNMQITGILDPENYMPEIAGTEEMADAFVVQVNDPDDPSKTRTLLVSQKAYDEKNQPRAFYNRAVNRLYRGFNAVPGKESTVDIGGLKIKGQELVGNQLRNELNEEQQRAAAMMSKPTLAHVPGVGYVLADGPKGLMEYISRPDIAPKVQWGSK